VEDTDLAHLAGYYDAVGNITVHISQTDDYNIGYQFQPVLRLNSPVNDDNPIIGKLMEYCEQNGVKYSLSEKAQSNDPEKKTYEWFCKNPASIKRFLEPLMRYLVTQFEISVVMVEEIIPRIEDGRHLEKDGFFELMEFADLIRESNRQHARMKYTREYFAEEWSLSE
jgi:hypothetical protein